MNLLPKKGSVLVFSLIVLSFMLVSALSIASVSVSERRSASTTEKSARSFQVADSGVEKLLQKIYKGNSADLNALQTAVDSSQTCQNGVIAGSTASGSFKVSLYDESNAQIACNDTDWREKAVKLRSEGISGNTTRAVEVAVAAASSELNIEVVVGSVSACRGTSIATCPAGTVVVGGGHSTVASCGCDEDQRFPVSSAPDKATNSWRSVVECATNRAYAVCASLL